MVKALHRAGIEVILDVVYNHTGEGNHLGPDALAPRHRQRAYYRLDPTTRATTWTSPAAATARPAAPAHAPARARQPALLGREMHVDGFRFDLAPDARARAARRRQPRARFFEIDPPGSGAVAREADRRALGPRARAATGSATFPPAGRSGTGATATACGASGAATRGQLAELASRLSGSSDLFEPSGRGAVRQHQLRHLPRRLHARDLVSYEQKHNEANGEDNRDGNDDNWSRNWGVEGADGRSATILRMRDRAMRKLPRHARLLAGRADALARRRDRAHAARQQQRLLPGQRDHLDRLGPRRRRRASCSRSRARCFAIRARNPVLRRRRFFRGASSPARAARRTSPGCGPTAAR